MESGWRSRQYGRRSNAQLPCCNNHGGNCYGNCIVKNKIAASIAGDKRYQGVPCKYGHAGIRFTVNADCVDCAMGRQKTIARKLYLDEYRKTSGKLKVYQETYQKNYEQRAKVKTKRAAYRKANPAIGAARTQKYLTSKSHRTPKWLTLDDFWMISEAYELAALRTKLFGFSWHVDHVVPLRGALVSGLHGPHNLQVIPGLDNMRKSNQFQST